MAQGFAVVSNSPGASESRGLIAQALGIVWLVYFFTEIHTLFGAVLGINAFYPVIVLYLFYFAVARPLQVVQVISLPITWVLALTALIPAFMFFLGGTSNPFAWSSLVGRVSFFAAFAGSAVVLLDPDGPQMLRKAARVALAIAVALNFTDLFLDNPLNRAEETGRVAGLYGDANNSAAAVGTLLILSIDFSKQSVRDLIVVGVSFLAILATQSRSGLIFGTLILVAYLTLPRGAGTFSAAGRLSLGLAGFLVLALVAVLGFQLTDLGLDQIWRIRNLLSLDLSDPSTLGRLERAIYTTEKFFEHFWTGQGLGGPRFYGIFSHNAFLEIGLEYGIGGLLTYVGLILYIVFKAFRFGIARNMGMAIIAFQIAYYSMFSHTVQTGSLFAAFVAAVAVNAAVSRPEENEGGISRRLAGHATG